MKYLEYLRAHYSMRLLVHRSLIHSLTLKSYEYMSHIVVHIFPVRRTESKYSGQLLGSIAFSFPFPLVDCLAVRGFFGAPSLGPASKVSAEVSSFRFLPVDVDVRCLGGILLAGLQNGGGARARGVTEGGAHAKGVTTRCDKRETRLVTSLGFA